MGGSAWEEQPGAAELGDPCSRCLWHRGSRFPRFWVRDVVPWGWKLVSPSPAWPRRHWEWRECDPKPLSSLGKQGKAIHALTMPFPSSPFPVPRAQGRREQNGAGTELSSNPAPLPVLESSFPASGIPMDGWEPWDGNHSHPTSQGRPGKSHHSHPTSHRRPGNTQHTHTVLPNRGWGTCHWDLGRKGLFQAPGKLWEA